jgi:DNA polymerase-3 subunit epsilon
LGTAIDESEVFELLNSGVPEFDLDIYKIVKKSLGKMDSGKIIPLPKPALNAEFESS